MGNKSALSGVELYMTCPSCGQPLQGSMKIEIIGQMRLDFSDGVRYTDSTDDVFGVPI